MTSVPTTATRAPLSALLYRFTRMIVSRIARPTFTGLDNYPDTGADADSSYEVVYVLQNRALTDLAVLEVTCQEQGFTSPFADLSVAPDTTTDEAFQESSRFFPLLRASGGRITMREHSARLSRLVESPLALRNKILLVPVSIFWGRAMSTEASAFSILTSENWSATGRFKRLLNLFINRHNIYVHTGRPIALAEVAPPDLPANRAIRRTARLLRSRFRAQKVTALGPDFSHRRTLVEQVVNSRPVRQAINEYVAEHSQKEKQLSERQLNKLKRKAAKLATKHARTIASDMSHPTIRVLASLLRWFWTKIYDGIRVRGIESLEAVSASHTLVYVPSHRSHIDYLLLSYLLYHRGFMIPHIAAGDNLNQPIMGSILRRAGAIFMRRSFRGDALYSTVFSEYMYFVYRRGHCVEFFPEGGRTRTGRLLPAKFGLIKMALDHQLRGLPKPIAFVPVYCGYEKVIEGSSYLDELRGANKRNESVTDVLRNLKLVRQDFGSVDVNFGAPIKLDEWLEHNRSDDIDQLGRDIMHGINGNATVNPVNLVALVTLATANSAIEEHALLSQIELYQHLIADLFKDSGVIASEASPAQVIEQVEALGLLTRYQEAYGEVLGHEPYAAIFMTWYRNNVVHTLALPALIACLTINRRRPLGRDALQEMVERVYPYLAAELSIPQHFTTFDDCLHTMLEQGLLRQKGDYFLPLTPEDPQHYQLNLLAQLVSQTLERMFIVIYQLVQQTHTRETLEASSRLIAQKISRFYGINAPEFSDQRLFNGFIDHLLANQVISINDDDTLAVDASIHKVLRMARYVIDVKIRYGVTNAMLPLANGTTEQ